MSCSGNKIRVPNFTNAERIHLVQLIARKYAVILEDKKTDRTSTLQKDKAWQAIEQDFNSLSGSNTFRKAACLKKCYENRKKKLRKMLAEERRETMLTGGGPPPKLKKNEDEDILFSFVNKETLVGLENRFDDDAEESLIQVQDEQDEILEYVEDSSDEEPIPSTSTLDATASQKKHVTEIRGGENNSTPDDFSTNNWQKYTPKLLQMPINSVLTVTEKKSCEDNKEENKEMKITNILDSCPAQPALALFYAPIITIFSFDDNFLDNKKKCKSKTTSNCSQNVDIFRHSKKV
ncbi:hypothetical protein JTB14_017528 [Gonioctena quinquepunctata]|nr:hypothetical protein JTB14_017528 [Gonioctena quinquepunctata]